MDDTAKPKPDIKKTKAENDKDKEKMEVDTDEMEVEDEDDKKKENEKEKVIEKDEDTDDDDDSSLDDNIKELLQSNIIHSSTHPQKRYVAKTESEKSPVPKETKKDKKKHGKKRRTADELDIKKADAEFKKGKIVSAAPPTKKKKAATNAKMTKPRRTKALDED